MISKSRFSSLVRSKLFVFAVISVSIGIIFIAGCDKQNDKQASVAAAKKVEDKEIEKESKNIAMEPKKIKLETSMGDIVVELNQKAAPVTVNNFLRYAEEGFFDGTIFHRVISDFMIQGGGFTVDMNQKKTQEPIVNEAYNGLKNDRGTIAMARTSIPDSATCQFFINLKNNDFLNYVERNNPGYAVFGRTVEGMDVVDRIAAVKTANRNGMGDVPVETVLIKSVKVVSGQE